MKKILLTLLVTIGMIGSSLSQVAIPGETFAANPARFNGRPVSVKNIEIVKSCATGGPAIGGPVGTMSHGAPGAIGTPSAPSNFPCNPPRGYSKVDLHFKGAPDFNGCFFMLDAMKNQMNRECGHTNTPAMVSFKGESRVGYVITAYRLGI